MHNFNLRKKEINLLLFDTWIVFGYMPFILLDKKVSWLSGRNFFDDEKEVCRRNKKEKKIIDDEGTEFYI